jgi:CrcB protein
MEHPDGAAPTATGVSLGVSILTVALGGALGAVCRYLVAGWIQALTAGLFPFGTLVVNASGCFVFGALAAALTGSPLAPGPARLLLLVGFCGGYTTFSSFAGETLALVDAGKTALALAYVTASNLLCLAGIWVGFRLGSS